MIIFIIEFGYVPHYRSLTSISSTVVQRFQRQSEPKRRYEQLIWFCQAKNFPHQIKCRNKVPGCVSQVYITALDEGRFGFRVIQIQRWLKASGTVMRRADGLTPAEICCVPRLYPRHRAQCGLTPSRANGFYNIFQTMKKKALEYQLICLLSR